MSTLETPRVSIEQSLANDGVCVVKTRGCSMNPLFKTHRDAVMILPPTRPFRKYDIVLYTYNGTDYVLHRIVGFKGDLCLIRGDNTYVTERVPKDKIIGVVASFNRKGRRYDMTELSYRLYSRLWVLIYPIRFATHKTRGTLSKIKHKIIGRKA